jgi:cation:H+ antiporter
MLNLLMCIVSLAILIKAVDWAITFSSKLARIMRLSEFIISFFIVATISVMPESAISIISALRGVPEFGLGTLLGSNIADLTLVFGVVAAFSARGLKVKSEILKKDFFYLILLLLPVVMGIDGEFSRIDGIVLIISGIVFYATLSIESKMFTKELDPEEKKMMPYTLVALIASMGIILLAAYFTVHFGVAAANSIGIPPLLVSLTIIAIGSCLPELIFSLKATKTNHGDLAIGDILGTVVTDATIILGLVAVITPFTFRPEFIYLTGLAMCLAAGLVLVFIRTDKVLSRKEGIFLLMFYIAYLVTEVLMNAAF